MATLEKIRNKSVMLIIVIGVALLAFIIGDGLTSSRQLFGNSTTVAKVDGSKISIEEFQKKYNEASVSHQDSEHQDAAYLQQTVVDGMVYDKLMNNEYEALGIEVSPSELSQYIVGDYPLPQVQQFVQALGAPSALQAHDMIFNPGKYQIDPSQVAAVRADWIKMENQVETALKGQKLAMLVSSCLQANALDIKSIKEENTIANITITKSDFNALKDEDFKATDSEIQSLYNKNKQQYRIKDEVRKAAYIAVDVVPSDKDNNHAKTVMDTISAQIKAEAGVEAARANGEVNVEESTQTLATAKVEPWLEKFLNEATVGQVSDIRTVGNVLSITKLLNVKNEVDSINVDMAMIQGAKAVQDSILNELNNGKTLKDFANSENVQAQENQWLNLMNVKAQDKNAKEKLLGAEVNKFFVIDSNENGAVVYRVNEKKSVKKMFDIAQVSFQILPSDETRQNLLEALETYVDKNNTPETFVKNAIPAGYQAVQTYLTGEMPNLCRVADLATAQKYQDRIVNINGHYMGSIMNSRRAVQWVFANEKGQVSPVFDKEGQYGKIIAVAVEDIIPTDYISMNEPSVKEALTKEVVKNKKAEKLIADFTGKASDMKAYAALMNSAVDTTTAAFADGLIPMVGIEPAVVGAIAGAKEGTISAPVQGNNGVYVFQVLKNENKGTQLSDEEAANRFNQRIGGQVVARGLFQVLRAGAEVTTDLGKFYNNQQ